MSESVLEADRLTAGYNGVSAVDGIDLSIAAGEVVSLLGPNGAGKSTTLLALAGMVPSMSGRVSFLGDRVDHERPYLSARRGLRLVPDDRGLFSSMTVREHLRLTRRKPDPEREKMLLEKFPAIAGLQSRKVGLLSGGEQQMLAVTCALLSRPTALMIDEMSLGLAPLVVTAMLPAIRELALDEGIAVLLVEQHVELALAVSDRAAVLNHGRIVLSGDAGKLLRDKESLQGAYFE